MCAVRQLVAARSSESCLALTGAIARSPYGEGGRCINCGKKLFHARSLTGSVLAWRIAYWQVTCRAQPAIITLANTSHGALAMMATGCYCTSRTRRIASFSMPTMEALAGQIASVGSASLQTNAMTITSSMPCLTIALNIRDRKDWTALNCIYVDKAIVAL